jgi:hypothetical protein
LEKCGEVPGVTPGVVGVLLCSEYGVALLEVSEGMGGKDEDGSAVALEAEAGEVGEDLCFGEDEE